MERDGFCEMITGAALFLADASFCDFVKDFRTEFLRYALFNPSSDAGIIIITQAQHVVVSTSIST